jgi:hypothetical protein
MLCVNELEARGSVTVTTEPTAAGEGDTVGVVALGMLVRTIELLSDTGPIAHATADPV